MSLGKIEKRNFISILSSDGTIRKEVPEGSEGSVRREFEKKDGTKGVKFEEIFQFVEGMIEEIGFYEGDFGKLLQVTIDGLTLSIPTSQPYAEDLMKKIPNIDMSKPVKLTPYFIDDGKGKTKKGISVTQGTDKIKNYFYDETTKTNINGFPSPTGNEKGNKDLWKVYFITARVFLEKYITDNFVKKSVEAPSWGTPEKAEKDFDDITADDIKFN